MKNSIYLLKIAEPNLLREFVLLGILFFQAQVFAQTQPSTISFIPSTTTSYQGAHQQEYFTMLSEEIWEVELEEDLREEKELHPLHTQAMIQLQKDNCFGPTRQLVEMDIMIDALSSRLIFIFGLMLAFGVIYMGIWFVDGLKSPKGVF